MYSGAGKARIPTCLLQPLSAGQGQSPGPGKASWGLRAQHPIEQNKVQITCLRNPPLFPPHVSALPGVSQAQLVGGDSAHTGNVRTGSRCQGSCQLQNGCCFLTGGFQGRLGASPNPHGISPRGSCWPVRLLKIVPACSQNQHHPIFHTRHQHGLTMNR